jgi:hypothetical protein
MDAQAIIDAVVAVTGPWAKLRRAEEREANRASRRHETLCRSNATRTSLREAVFAEMAVGIVKTSGGGRTIFPKRNLYYSVRKLIQEHTKEELSYGYFESLVKEWEKNHGAVPGMYCDPRGYLVEPHTGRVVPLGTREVEQYTIPPLLYDKILYVEKKGFHELFKWARTADRYDMAIVCAEGYASDAAKLLLARAEQGARMTILCLHDADPYGYNIARRLRMATRIQHTIQVIDMGMSLADALELGLATEDFIRTKALPAGLELTDLEREYFEGEFEGFQGKKKLWRCRRVELNALAADPDRFLAYVEEKLAQHGCARKLLPRPKVIRREAKELLLQYLNQAARAQVNELLNVDALVNDLADSLAGVVSLHGIPAAMDRWARGLGPEWWKAQVEGQVQELVHGVADEMRRQALVRIGQRDDRSLHA